MINNDYAFSLRLNLAFNAMDSLFTFCPLYKSKLLLHYENIFKPIQDFICKKVGSVLPISSRNVEPQRNDLDLMHTATKTMLGYIDTEISTEKRKNVIASLLVVKGEMQKLNDLLS